MTELRSAPTVSTVNEAFTKFLKASINLDPKDTKGARRSRTWLRERLAGFHDTYDDFPLQYAEKHIDYGSFARRTQLRPLDDVDIIHCISAEGAWYTDHGSYISITTFDNSRLAGFRHDGASTLNSRRVLRKLVKHLKEIPQYDDAGIKVDGVAATLELNSYDWNFDITPGFFTVPALDGRTYYLIPDGNGHWMKTDPRKDRDRVTAVNQRHSGRVLDVVRMMKFWNRRPTMPSVPSYAFEAMLLDHYEGRLTTADEWIDMEVPGVLTHIASAVYGAIQDPKGIQGDLNTLDFSSRMRVAQRAASDASKASEARQLENQGDHKAAIKKWGEVFGQSFPSYAE